MNFKFISYFLFGCITVSASGADRYEAEDAIVDQNAVQKVSDSKASGGFYVEMKEGKLSFDVEVTTAGFYTLWAKYSEPDDPNGKIQNLAVNGASTGQISFPQVDTFTLIKASSKIKLNAGQNTIDITKSWGWVNIDFIEITPYVATPFSITSSLVTPGASENAKKVYAFLIDNFQKKVISGVMTNTVMLNDGHYTPNTVETQTEVDWIIDATGKTPALIGLDFMHATGKNSEGEWYKGYTNATVSLAEDIFKKGGIPIYCWHWKDPLQTVEAFYSKSSGNTPYTDFNLLKAYTDSTTCETFNTSSPEYIAIVKDLDIIAGYLKKLADKNVPVLFRPVHEASGKWFWWGYKGAKACKGLYRLIFERFTSYHKLNNLIWVWTSDEAGDAMSWYPGDDFVDIIGRDYYYYPREANHGSLVASFEKLKDIYGVDKIITLSENGSVPFPDNMVEDGAGWSWFMPWYGEYTMDGWAHDNTAADWNTIMRHAYVLTLDEMPGWDNYTTYVKPEMPKFSLTHSVTYAEGNINVVVSPGNYAVELYNANGSKISVLNKGLLAGGKYAFDVSDIAKGMYLVRIVELNKKEIIVNRVMIK